MSRVFSAPSRRSSPRVSPTDLVCWEALNPKGKAVRQARRLYKRSLAPEERIPWRWIKEGLAREPTDPAEPWNGHLLLAGLRERARHIRRVVGYAYGAHVSGYGGYGAYLGVSERCRGRGIGTRLWRLLIQRLQLDAACAGVALPFVIWESRPPAVDASDEEHAIWRSRLRLWATVGAWQVSGVSFWTPNFADPSGPPVAEQLFLLPVDQPAAAFDGRALRGVVSGLHHQVYGQVGDDALLRETLRPGCRPSLERVPGS